MRKIDAIIIHCADTFPEMDIGADAIRGWHVNQNNWRDIGYHFVIRRNGEVEKGRDVAVAGAHVAGHNAHSIGICLVGGKARAHRQATNFTKHQWAALKFLVDDLLAEYPDAVVRGHNDYTAGKTCPTFDVRAWWDQ